MATTNENHSMISMETQTTPFHHENNPVLMLVAGISCMIAGIVKLVQCGRQNGLPSLIALIIFTCFRYVRYGYISDSGRQLMIGLSFATGGLTLIWNAYKLELVQDLSIRFMSLKIHVLVIISGLILIGYIQENVLVIILGLILLLLILS